jgi:atypical dual specificity phosphatase
MALNALLAVGHRVYVHCNAGVCRAPATVLGYLCHFREMSMQDGLEYIRSQRPQVHPYISAVEIALEKLSKQSI